FALVHPLQSISFGLTHRLPGLADGLGNFIVIGLLRIVYHTLLFLPGFVYLIECRYDRVRNICVLKLYRHDLEARLVEVHDLLDFSPALIGYRSAADGNYLVRIAVSDDPAHHGLRDIIQGRLYSADLKKILNGILYHVLNRPLDVYNVEIAAEHDGLRL